MSDVEFKEVWEVEGRKKKSKKKSNKKIKKDSENLKRQGKVTFSAGEAKIQVYQDGVITSSSSGWGAEGIATAHSIAIAGLGMAEAAELRNATLRGGVKHD